MRKSNDKKGMQLGMPLGTASARLKKNLLFTYVKQCGDNVCYQCGKEILKADDLSVEHKTPYLDSDDPVKLFFDLDNIAFSHLRCNAGAARPRVPSHPSWTMYRKGCRCSGCIEANRLLVKKYRSRKRTSFAELENS